MVSSRSSPRRLQTVSVLITEIRYYQRNTRGVQSKGLGTELLTKDVTRSNMHGKVEDLTEVSITFLMFGCRSQYSCRPGLQNSRNMIE